MKIAIITLSKKGYELACKIKEADIYLPSNVIASPKGARQSQSYSYPLSSLITKIFNKYDALIFIMALGIVVREIAPLLNNKSEDPAIITIDEAGQHCISTLGGHEAGANKLTKKIAKIINAQPVITTASEGSKLAIGIGLKKNKSKEEIKEAILAALAKKNIELSNIGQISTIEIKKDDRALINACNDLGIPLRFVSKDQINQLEANFTTSNFVNQAIGVKAVSEPAALIGSENKQLIMKKTAYDGITIAIAR